MTLSFNVWPTRLCRCSASCSCSSSDSPARWTLKRLLPAWDGGTVTIAGTIDEGEEVSGFRVVHLPGHSPGQIALWRESDRLALTTD